MAKAKKPETSSVGTDNETTNNIQEAVAALHYSVTIVGTGNPESNLVKGEEKNVLKSVADILVNNGEATIKE